MAVSEAVYSFTTVIIFAIIIPDFTSVIYNS